jgi:ribose 5-phosphate isomerase B
MTIYFATDHAGYELKNILVAFVREELGHDVVDCGAYELKSDDDYPDYIQKAARAVSQNPLHNKAIVLGASGQGEAMVANKFSGVRAAVYYGAPQTSQVDAGGNELGIIASTRAHNDSNVLSLGARFITIPEAKEIVRSWLVTPFSNEVRHIRRIAEMNELSGIREEKKSGVLIPAIIPTSFKHLEDSLAIVEPFTHDVQVDIVDGVFVPFRSWPYQGSGSINLLSQYTSKYSIEVDLMIMNPETVIDVYARAGVQKIVVHAESTTALERIFEHHESHTYALGLSIQNDTPLEKLTPHLHRVDYVQLMGIAKIGSQGQPFDDRVLNRIMVLKKEFPELTVSIDGSVNADSLPLLWNVGAERFVCGSAIFASTDPSHAYQHLSSLVA